MNEALETLIFSVDDLSRLGRVPREWVIERVQGGLLVEPPPGPPEHWRFEAACLLRLRRMAVVERDFDAGPELAALVADLQEEIADLRRRLRRAPRWPEVDRD